MRTPPGQAALISVADEANERYEITGEVLRSQVQIPPILARHWFREGEASDPNLTVGYASNHDPALQIRDAA